MKKLYYALAVVLLLLSAFIAVKAVREVPEETVDSFFNFVAEGRVEEAEKLLADDYYQGKIITGILAENEWNSYEIVKVGITSLSGATAVVRNNDWDQEMQVKLSKSDAGWQIVSFPDFTGGTVYARRVENKQAEVVTAEGDVCILETNLISAGGAGYLLAIGGKVVAFTAFDPVAAAEVLAAGDSTLETEAGIYILDNPSYFRKRQGEVLPAEAEELIPAMEGVTLYLFNEKVQAVLMQPEGYIPDNIRVLLNKTGFSGTVHRQVVITADCSFSVEDRVNNENMQIEAGGKITIVPKGEGTEVTFDDGSRRVFENRVFLTSDESMLKVESLRRGSPEFSPAYQGRLEVFSRDGSLYLTNEVSLEDYLLTVVPSEMPISFGTEALKVQAVAARSYAAAAMLRSGYGALGAHVDDSTMSQVYNNGPERQESTAAIKDTRGLVLETADGQLVDTRFFSTSGGHTANAHEVWQGADGSFPGDIIPYLIAGPQVKGESLPDIATEEGAKQFFTEHNWAAYDAASPWFRWQVDMSGDELAESIGRNLAERYQAASDFVLTKSGEDYKSLPISKDPLGELLDLQVVQRGEGGNIMMLDIIGNKGSYRLIKEFNIRFVLRPVQCWEDQPPVFIERHDGSRVADYAIMPSAFFSFDIQRDQHGDIDKINFYGGGNGHGAGMSQYGAKGLAETGMDFVQILKHYYPGSQLRNINSAH